MAVLSKQDLRALFVLLAVAILFDSVRTGFLLGGVIVFLIVGGVAVFIDNAAFTDLKKEVQKTIAVKDVEILIRLSIGVVLLGILAQFELLIFVGVIIGELILLLPIDPLKVDLWMLTVPREAAQMQDTSAAKQPKMPKPQPKKSSK